MSLNAIDRASAPQARRSGKLTRNNVEALEPRVLLSGHGPLAHASKMGADASAGATPAVFMDPVQSLESLFDQANVIVTYGKLPATDSGSAATQGSIPGVEVVTENNGTILLIIDPNAGPIPDTGGPTAPNPRRPLNHGWDDGDGDAGNSQGNPGSNDQQGSNGGTSSSGNSAGGNSSSGTSSSGSSSSGSNGSTGNNGNSKGNSGSGSTGTGSTGTGGSNNSSGGNSSSNQQSNNTGADNSGPQGQPFLSHGNGGPIPTYDPPGDQSGGATPQVQHPGSTPPPALLPSTPVKISDPAPAAVTPLAMTPARESAAISTNSTGSSPTFSVTPVAAAHDASVPSAKGGAVDVPPAGVHVPLQLAATMPPVFSIQRAIEAVPAAARAVKDQVAVAGAVVDGVQAVTSEAIRQAVPAQAAYNFIRFDSASFNDAVAAFANELATLTKPAAARPSTARAWAITASVLGVDAILLGYWRRKVRLEKRARLVMARAMARARRRSGTIWW